MRVSLSTASAPVRQPSQKPTSIALGDADDRYIREAECSRLSGLSRTTRWRLERAGKFPQRRQLSENTVGWKWSEIIAWRESRPTATGAAGP